MHRWLMVLVLCLFRVNGFSADLSEVTYDQWVDERGNITIPGGYRKDWSHLGSWLVANKKAPGYGFHDVYTQPEAVVQFLQTGEFIDGSVLIKEVREVVQGPQTTGHAQWAGDIRVWFVMIKDSVGRYKDSSHWSEGWGWALFKAGKGDASGALTNVSDGFEQSCKGCHVPAKNRDWVFLEGYPTLK